jgi:hypothetical protein
MRRRIAVAAALPVLLAACAEQPRPGTYDQVFSEGSALARSGYKGTLVIEPERRFRLQLPMVSLSGDYRRSGDSIYLESGSADARMVMLKAQMGALRGMLGRDLVEQRFVRRRQ